MLLCIHVKLARAMLRITQRELAAMTGISVITIKRMEKSDDAIERANLKTLKKIKTTFESLGIEFLYPETEGSDVGVGIKYLRIPKKP
ncbi:MAG: helix-turn-helix transcriptional regulator [Proteobacteria bacterium]|nr:helix-turn-helix transcriptional regulator [Pseudomonadota bacterium]